MSLAQVLRPYEGSSSPLSTRLPQKIRKTSTACLGCKLRKTKCTGGQPCSACNIRSGDCTYDAENDRRKKIANRRNIEELKEARSKLESHRWLLGGIIATISAGDVQQINDLIYMIKNEGDISQLAAHTRNGLRYNIGLARAYDAIVFEIDDPTELPSPSQMLPHLSALQSNHATSTAQLSRPMMVSDFPISRASPEVN